MSRIRLFRQILIVITVLVVDLITKYFLFSIDYFNLIPHFVSIANNGGNTGAAWGVFGGQTAFLIIMSIVMIAGIIVFDFVFKSGSVWFDVGLALVLGGALGNLIDRMMLGYVRDFIFLDFWPTFPIFNIADSMLCIGALFIVLSLLLRRGNNEK